MIKIKEYNFYWFYPSSYDEKFEKLSKACLYNSSGILKKGRKDGAPRKRLDRLYISFFTNLIRPKNLHYILPLRTRLYTQDLRCVLLRAHLIKIFRPNLTSCPVGVALITFCVKSMYLHKEYPNSVFLMSSPFTIFSIRYLDNKRSKLIYFHYFS